MKPRSHFLLDRENFFTQFYTMRYSVSTLMLCCLCVFLQAQSVVSFQSLQYPSLFIRHSNYNAYIQPVNSALDQKDASFKIVRGLSTDCADCISFESVNLPGQFLRHQNYRIVLGPITNDLNKKDASFRQRTNSTSSAVAFESFNFPRHYIRPRNNELFITEVGDYTRDNDVFFVQKSSFYQTPPGQSAAASANPPTDADMCWTESRTRGAGTFPNICGPNEDLDAGLCYPKCQAGYVGVGPVCWKSCPPGYRDDGAFCAKPAAYGRGGGYPWKFGDGLNLDAAKARCEKDNRQGCEKYGEIMYPKCSEGFSPAGCCICSPVCPAGFVDIGVSCTKPSYGRGAGTVPKNCPSGKVNQAGLCYVPCPAGFNGVGPVCWANQCPNVFPIKCAAGCARTTNACIKAVVSQVTTPLEMVVNITGIALSGGGSAVAKSAAVTSAKTIAKASIKSQMIRKAKEMGKELLESAAENAASTFYEAQLTGEFSWEDLDPTGVANVVKAFNKPLCRDFK
jgi:hypothetical protein